MYQVSHRLNISGSIVREKREIEREIGQTWGLMHCSYSVCEHVLPYFPVSNAPLV